MTEEQKNHAWEKHWHFHYESQICVPQVPGIFLKWWWVLLCIIVLGNILRSDAKNWSLGVVVHRFQYFGWVYWKYGLFWKPSLLSILHLDSVVTGNVYSLRLVKLLEDALLENSGAGKPKLYSLVCVLVNRWWLYSILEVRLTIPAHNGFMMCYVCKGLLKKHAGDRTEQYGVNLQPQILLIICWHGLNEPLRVLDLQFPYRSFLVVKANGDLLVGRGEADFQFILGLLESLFCGISVSAGSLNQQCRCTLME